MARIRTIKPEFFTSSDIVNLTPLSRLFYVSLWCEADRDGRLKWDAQTLKMRYLPGDDCDVSDLADELVGRDLIAIYEVDGKKYAEIPSFKNHQIINNREAVSILPARVKVACPRDQGEGKEGRERKGKEGKGMINTGDQQADAEKSKRTELISAKTILEEIPDLAEQTVIDYLAVRKAKRAPMTRTAWDSIKEQILITQERFGIPPDKALSVAVKQNWQGFEADWIGKHLGVIGNAKNQSGSGSFIPNHDDTSWADGLADAL